MIRHLGAVQATGSPDGGPVTSRIVIVGDDPEIASLIGRALAAAGYVTDLCGGWTQGLPRAPESHDELIVAGRLAAGLDGPLTRDQPRIRETAHLHHEVIRAGKLRLDLGRLAADTGHGPVPLTRLEFLLLRELAEHAGQPVPKSDLLAAVWGYEFDPGSNVVDVCVRRLRSKLGFGLITTVRGGGYQLAGQLLRSRYGTSERCSGPCCGTGFLSPWPSPAERRAPAAARSAGQRRGAKEIAAMLVLSDRLAAKAGERARSGRGRRPGYPGLRAGSTPWISARHGTVNAMPADRKMPW